jgi:hypothetical protein
MSVSKGMPSRSQTRLQLLFAQAGTEPGMAGALTDAGGSYVSTPYMPHQHGCLATRHMPLAVMQLLSR